MLLYGLVEFHELHGDWCLSSLSQIRLGHVSDSLLPESCRFFVVLQLTWVYKILNAWSAPKHFQLYGILTQGKGRAEEVFLLHLVFLLCREFHICTGQSCPELRSRALNFFYTMRDYTALHRVGFLCYNIAWEVHSTLCVCLDLLNREVV